MERKETGEEDYWERLSQALLHAIVRNKSSKISVHFSAFSISEVSVRLDSDYCFLFPNHKKIMNSFPYYILLVEGEVFEQCVIFSVNNPQIIHDQNLANFLLVLDNLPSFHHIALFPSFV